MATVFVQADDFSGAAEVGYCFVEHGLSAQVSLGTGTASGTYDGVASAAAPVTDVVVIDTHSRAMSATEAEALVKDAFSAPAASGAQVMFKKMDSLWRGNIRAETAALAGLGYHVVVAGALPQLQRTVRAGRPVAAGSPLAETDLWQAEASAPPVDIPSLLRPEEPASVQSLDLEAVRSSSVPSRLAGLLDGRPALVVADGETVQDLEHVVDALLELGFQAGGRRIVLVGTGGVADVLAHRLSTRLARNAHSVAAANAPAAEPPGAERPVLAVVGSASKTAQAQLAQLEAEGFRVVRLHPLYAGAKDAYAPQLAQVSADLSAGHRVAITLAAAKVDPSGAARIVQALSAFAAQAAKATPADLILTGGETAREVLEALGRSSLVPLVAVQHGAVLSRADDGTAFGVALRIQRGRHHHLGAHAGAVAHGHCHVGKLVLGC